MKRENLKLLLMLSMAFALGDYPKCFELIKMAKTHGEASFK